MPDLSPLAPPPVVTRSVTVSADEMTSRARGFADALRNSLPAGAPMLAMLLGNDPESVALFFALATIECPLVLFGPDPRGWTTAPAWPRGTCLVLPPGRAHLAAEATPQGLAVCCVPDSAPTSASPATFTPRTPGLVFLTSGSTGAPKPVYRPFGTLVGAAQMLASVLPLADAAGIIGAVPLDRALGANNALMLATVTGRTLGLLERFDHNDFFALCEQGHWGYWAGTPALADVLSRSVRVVPPGMPAWGTVAGRVSAPLAEAYARRFGVPLRALYGTTETFTIAIDLDTTVHGVPGTVGRPLPGIDVVIGNPEAPFGPGETGRVWVRTPWIMGGYGYPPEVLSPVSNGWWETPDLGHLTDDGRLLLEGRADDRVRTAAGYILDPRALAAALEAVDGVRDVVVAPIDGADGSTFAVLVEADDAVRSPALRAVLAAALPPSAQPRIVRVVSQLPRQSTGRVDRRACIDLLIRSQEPVTRP